MMVRGILHVGSWNSSSLSIDRRWALSEEKYLLEMTVRGILHVGLWNSSSLWIDQRAAAALVGVEEAGGDGAPAFGGDEVGRSGAANVDGMPIGDGDGGPAHGGPALGDGVPIGDGDGAAAALQAADHT